MRKVRCQGEAKAPTQNSKSRHSKGAINTTSSKNALPSLRGIGQRLTQFMSEYSGYFVVRGKDVGKSTRDFLSGLLGTERRKNMERIHGDIPQSNYQGIQQFIVSVRGSAAGGFVGADRLAG